MSVSCLGRHLAGLVAVAVVALALADPARAQYPAPALERASGRGRCRRSGRGQAPLQRTVRAVPRHRRERRLRALAAQAGVHARLPTTPGCSPWCASGIPGVMPGFGDANGPRRSWQLAAFVRAFNRQGGEPAPGNPQNGLAVYRATRLRGLPRGRRRGPRPRSRPFGHRRRSAVPRICRRHSSNRRRGCPTDTSWSRRGRAPAPRCAACASAKTRSGSTSATPADACTLSAPPTWPSSGARPGRA